MMRRCFVNLVLIASSAFFTLPALCLGSTTPPTLQADQQNVQCSELDQEFIEKILLEVAATSGEQRLIEISDSFLGREAFWQQAKENTAEDKVEKKEEVLAVNLNKLNCVTYGEIVLATYHASDWQSFISELAKIRYKDDVPSTARRLHFPSVDWIPNLIDTLGYTSDVTREIAAKFDPASLKKAGPVTIDKESFFKTFYTADYYRLLSVYPKQADRVVKGVELEYIDFDAMWTPSQANPEELVAFLGEELALFSELSLLLGETSEAKDSDEVQSRVKVLKSELDRMRREVRLIGAELKPEFVKALPKISFVSLVKPTHEIKKSDGTLVTKMLVTHHGFVLKKQGKLYFRHTSTVRAKKVVDIPFEEYIGNFLVTGGNTDRVDNRRSQWRGLHFMKIN